MLLFSNCVKGKDLNKLLSLEMKLKKSYSFSLVRHSHTVYTVLPLRYLLKDVYHFLCHLFLKDENKTDKTLTLETAGQESLLTVSIPFASNTGSF